MEKTRQLSLAQLVKAQIEPYFFDWALAWPDSGQKKLDSFLQNHA